MRLQWKPEVYGTWQWQIIAFKEGQGWVESDGPSGHGFWQFVSYPEPGFMGAWRT